MNKSWKSKSISYNSRLINSKSITNLMNSNEMEMNDNIKSILNQMSSLTPDDASATSDDSIKIIKPSEIKFNSLHQILPSEKESCSLDAKPDTKVTIKDFILIKSLASGAYGRVILSRKKNTKDLFAIKVLNIEKMREKNCVDTVLNEKTILGNLDSQFVTKGIYSFQSSKYLYMVMEYVKGGDLAGLLEQAGYFEEPMAKFYIA